MRYYIDVRAASAHFSAQELEALGARHTSGFSLAELADRLGGIGELVGDGLDRYGLIQSDIEALVRWANAATLIH